MSSTDIKCPHCGQSFSVDQALSSHLQEQLEKEFQDKLADASKRSAQEATAKFQKELGYLTEKLEQKEKQLDEANKIELKVRQEKELLEDQKRQFELDKQRQLDQERELIRQKAQSEILDSFKLKEKEKDKIIDDLKNSLEDAQRKASQGSQQLQGEVAELDVEDTLKSQFPFDVIEPVAKGVHGADISQTVRTNMGNVCGVILWETKRTKAWKDEWLGKLKEDLRATKANVPIIITNTLPKEIQGGLGLLENVWVCSFQYFQPLAELVRQKLIAVAREKYIAADRGTKAESLYQYIVSHEFTQQVESIIEIYHDLQEQTNKERTYFEKLWKYREVQSQRLFKATAGVVGAIQGQIGSAMPTIKGMDLPELGE